MAVLVVDEGRELPDALQRAAQDCGVRLKRGEPPVGVLREAIGEYRRLFHPRQVDEIDARRRVALEAMKSFAEFRPRLAGALVHGDGPLDRVRLLLNADPPERLIMRLSDLHIPWHDGEATLCYAGNRRETHPAFRFQAGDTGIELVVLDAKGPSDPPWDALANAPLSLLSRTRLAALLDGTP